MNDRLEPVDPLGCQRFFNLVKRLKDIISFVAIKSQRNIEESRVDLLKKRLLARILRNKRGPEYPGSRSCGCLGDRRAVTARSRPDYKNILTFQHSEYLWSRCGVAARVHVTPQGTTSQREEDRASTRGNPGTPPSPSGMSESMDLAP